METSVDNRLPEDLLSSAVSPAENPTEIELSRRQGASRS